MGFRSRPRIAAAIDYIYRAFYSEGPDLRYSFPRQQVGARWFPNYMELMTTTDLAGQNHSYVATEENYRVLREFQRNNLLVPIVGDFGGDKAIQAVGRYLREQARRRTTIYTSNVEQYLFQNDAWQRYYTERGDAADRQQQHVHPRVLQHGVPVSAGHHHARSALRAAARSDPQPAERVSRRRARRPTTTSSPARSSSRRRSLVRVFVAMARLNLRSSPAEIRHQRRNIARG